MVLLEHGEWVRMALDFDRAGNVVGRSYEVHSARGEVTSVVVAEVAPFEDWRHQMEDLLSNVAFSVSLF